MRQLDIEFEPEHSQFSHLPYSERLKLLKDFDLSFIGKNGRLSLHNVHSFPAKFPPQLPYTFIKELTKENEIVLDPMMGSCTTLIEALRLKRVAYGCDIDPLSILIANAKLSSIDIEKIHRTGKSVLNNAFKNFSVNKSKIEKGILNYFDGKSLEFINYWFKKETQLELFALVQQINKLEDEEEMNFLKLIFSSIIITKSGGVSLATDLAHTRPHIAKGKSPASAFEEFNKKMSSTLKNYIPLEKPNFKIFRSDAKEIPLASNSVDLIVTSPPYANNAIDYLRAHKFSLVWFGYSLENITDVRNNFIGNNSFKGKDLVALPKRCMDIIGLVKKVDKQKGASLHCYYSEMRAVIQEMFRVIKNNKTVVIVVASSVIKGIDTLTHECLTDIGKEIGFNLIGINQRVLDRDRRMMPTRWKRNENSQIETRMHEEYVIIFQK